MAAETPPRTRPTWVRLLRWVLSLWLLWCLLGWLLLPPLLKSQLESRGSAALGRTLSVGSVEFYPWSLQLTLNDLAVAGVAGSGPQLTVQHLSANLELESLLRMAPVVDGLQVDAPHLHLQYLGAAKYDIDDVLARLRGPDTAPSDTPFYFALYNLRVHDGALTFGEHGPAGERLHLVRALNLELPFLSNLDYRRNTQVHPHLAFTLDGSPFDSDAQGTPFAPSRHMEMHLRVQHFDLRPWLPYVPAWLAVQPREGVLDADLQLVFQQTPNVAVSLSGLVQAEGLRLVDAAGAEVLRSDKIDLQLADVRPLEHSAALQLLRLQSPALHWLGRRAGRLQVDLLEPGAAGAAPAAVTQTPPAAPWRLTLKQLEIADGQVNWRDENYRPAAAVVLAGVQLQAKDLAWPLPDAPMELQASAQLGDAGSPGQVNLHGSASVDHGELQVVLHQGALALAAPWLSPYVVPSLSGRLDARAQARWKAGQVQVTLEQLTASDLALNGANKAPAGAGRTGASSGDLPHIGRLELRDALFDSAAHRIQLGKVRVLQASTGLRRNEDGHWMFEAWRRSAPPAADDPPSAAAPPWQWSLDSLQVQDGAVVFADRSTRRPVRLEVTGLQLQTTALDSAGSRPVDLRLALQLRAGQTEPGSLRFKGQAGLAPLRLRGQIDAVDLPAHALAPYVSDRLNLDLLRADANLHGQLQFTDTSNGPQLRLRADAALEDFRANTLASGEGSGTDKGSANTGLALGEELLSWKSLSLPGLALDLTPGAAPRLQIGETALTDFFARVTVSPQGRINLQDLIKPAAPALAQTPPVAAALPAQIQLGPLSLVHGGVQFTDHFVRPNYSASLSELTGRLGPVATATTSTPAALADLELRGRAEGTAALEILGKFNPLAQPLAFDIRAKVTELELPPLSPYAIKYAGYGIERGKFSMDAHYQLDGRGQLQANNQLVLQQLSFGEEVPGAEHSLPVKLAAALLADEDGVINLELPISGSLDDPQFSVGPVLWSIVKNIIGKALTSPFALLSGAGGGSEDAGKVPFALGSSALTPQATQALDKLVQSLAKKTQLELTITGDAHLDAEREAFKRERLQDLLLAEKRRRLAGDGQDAAAITSVSAAEMPSLLKTVYRRAEINKPRNVLGLTRDLAPQEMQALLLASIPVDADAMRALALARSVAVKDYLAAHQFPSERLFLGNAKVALEPLAAGASYQAMAALSLAHH